MGRSHWSCLRVMVPPPMFVQVIEQAKSENKAVSKWCREAIEKVLNGTSTPIPTTPAEVGHARLILKGGEMDSHSFAMALTKAFKQQPVEEDGEETAPREVWMLVESLIEQKVLKAGMREGVRYVSLLS